MRDRGTKRHNDWKKAIRKKRISDSYACFSSENSWYDNLHQYSKNKIHCSCGMCARYNKTNNKGRKRKIHGNYAPSKNWSMPDKRTIMDMEEQIEEMEE